MIEDVELGTHRIGTYTLTDGIHCMPSVSVCSCSAYVCKLSFKTLLFFRRNHNVK